MSNQLDRDEVRRRYIEHERRYRGTEECDAAATFDRDIWPPPTPVPPRCPWGHETKMRAASKDIYWVWCGECRATGPDRPTPEAAIKAWDYLTGAEREARARGEALDDSFHGGSASIAKDLLEARADLARIQEQRP